MSSTLCLAIETATRGIGLAASFEGKQAGKTLDQGTAHARHLIPALDELLNELGVEIRRLGLVVVDVGPGSYTGLRVGIATALTLAKSSGADLAGVPFPTVLASGHPSSGVLGIVQNAFGGEYYVSCFEKTGDSLEEILPIQLMKPDEIPSRLPENALLIGDGVPLLKEKGFSLRSSDPKSWTPDPLVLLRLGMRKRAERGPDLPESVRPLYLRPSRAEIQFGKNRPAPP